MTDLQQLLQSLPPGTDVTVLLIHLADGSQRVQVRTDDAPTGTGMASNESGTELRLVDARQGTRSRVTESPLQAARRILDEEPKLRLKCAEWATLLGCSERELRRAVQKEVLPRCPKGEGKDNRALVIGAAEVVTYLSTIEAIERGALKAPAWYTDVRKGIAA